MKRKLLFMTAVLAAALPAAAWADYLTNPINITGPIKAEGEAVTHAHHYGEPDYNNFHLTGSGSWYVNGSYGYSPALDSYVTGSWTQQSLSSGNQAVTQANSSMTGYDESMQPIGAAAMETQLTVTVMDEPSAPPGTASINMDVWGLGSRDTSADYSSATMTGCVGSIDNFTNKNLTVASGGGLFAAYLEITVNAPDSDYWELEIDEQEFTSEFRPDPYHFSVSVPVILGQPYHFAFKYEDYFSVSKIYEPEYYGNAASVTLRVREEVPEPAAIVLLCSGVAALAAFARHRRR